MSDAPKRREIPCLFRVAERVVEPTGCVKTLIDPGGTGWVCGWKHLTGSTQLPESTRVA